MWVKNKSSILGARTLKNYKSAYKKLNSIKDIKYKDLRVYHIQECINNETPYTQSCVKNILHSLDKYALELDIVTRTYSQLLELNNNNCEPKKQRKPFTEEEIKLL